MKKYFSLHPFLFAIIPVINLYTVNWGSFTPDLLVLPIICLIGLTASLLYLVAKLRPSLYERTTILLSVFWIWLFSYSPVRSFGISLFTDTEVFRHHIFIPSWIFMLILIALTTYILAFNLRKTIRLLNIIGLSLLCIQAGMVFKNGLFSLSNAGQAVNHLSTPSDSLLASEQNRIIGLPRPNVYYIILDEYSGQKELKEILGFDNSEFIKYLNDRGFYVANESRSNYAWTGLAMPSYLNMEYWPVKCNEKDVNMCSPLEEVKPIKISKDNRVLQFFTSQGYSYIDITYGNYIGLASSSVVNNNFNIALLSMTPLERPLVTNYLQGKMKRKQVLQQFEELADTVNDKGPFLVYAHLLIPHHPYVFDRNGNEPPFKSMAMQATSEKDLYLGQIEFVNKLVKELLDKILSRDGKKPIIIIQADHGGPRIGKNMDENIRLRMSILNAYYVPDEVRQHLYPTITPINSFRSILKYYFQANLDLLEDESFYTYFVHSKQFLRVSKK